DLFHARATEGSDNVSGFAAFRGGWGANFSVNRNFFDLDPAFTSGLRTRESNGTLVPYQGLSRLTGLVNSSLGLNTPVFRTFNLTVTVQQGEAPIFSEAAEGKLHQLSATLGLRPSPSTRVEAQGVWVRLDRSRDGSQFSTTWLPRVKVEYQPTRA